MAAMTLFSLWDASPVARRISTDAAGRLALLRQIDARLRDLGIASHAEWHRHGGPTPKWVERLSHGGERALNPTTVADVEDSLRWAAGSVADIIAGKPPTELPPEDAVVFAEDADGNLVQLPIPSHLVAEVMALVIRRLGERDSSAD